MAKRKKAPEGIAIHSEGHATEIAKRNARWTHIPAPYRDIPEGEDAQERLDALNEQEKCDCLNFREGNVQKCACTLQIEQEEEAERHQQA